VQPLRDYPLVIDVTLSEATILAPWHRNALYIAISALLLVIGCVIVTLVLADRLQRQRYLNAKLKSAVASLRANEHKLRTFAEMSADWFWEQDADLRFTHDANIPLTSLATDVGKTRWDFADSAMAPQRWDLHKADLANRRPFRDFRWERIRTDGKRAYMSTSGDPIFSEAGVFLGYRGTGRDITADVEAAEDLRLAKERAEIAYRAKSEFLTNMSHELRTPLNAVIGFSELIHDQKPGSPTSNHMEWSEAILSSGRHLLSIVNNMLELARIDAGHCELADDRVMLAVVVQRSLTMVKLQAEEKRIQIVSTFDDPGASMHADNRAVKQVVLNLLNNAIKFTQAGGMVSVRCESDVNGDRVLVVADTGIGIDPAVLASLGEPFIQADPSISRRYGGTGLGLAISRKLMGLHGGTLTIESVPGRGTTMRAIFPGTRVIATPQRITALLSAA
jgi:signal transduction histidine kinase